VTFLSQVSDMLDRTVSARTFIIISVTVGVFSDVTLLHWLSGFRRLQESCDLSFGGLLEDEDDMNLDRLIWRQRHYAPSQSRTPLTPQHRILNSYDKLGSAHVPIFRITIFPKLTILPSSSIRTKQGVWPVCSLVQSALVWQGCSEENIHFFVIEKGKVR